MPEEKMSYQIWPWDGATEVVNGHSVPKLGNQYLSSHDYPVAYGEAVAAINRDPSLTGKKYVVRVKRGATVLQDEPFTAAPPQ